MTPLDNDILDLTHDISGVWESAGARLLARGGAALPALESGLNDNRLGSVAHWRILLVLRQLAREESIPAIRAALHRALARGDSSVIHGAIEALASFRTPEAVEELTSLLEHPDVDILKHAAVLAGKAGGVLAIGPLLQLLGSEDAAIRYSAVNGLIQLEDPSVRIALEQHLERETSTEVRELLLSRGRP